MNQHKRIIIFVYFYMEKWLLIRRPEMISKTCQNFRSLICLNDPLTPFRLFVWNGFFSFSGENPFISFKRVFEAHFCLRATNRLRLLLWLKCQECHQSNTGAILGSLSCRALIKKDIVVEFNLPTLFWSELWESEKLTTSILTFKFGMQWYFQAFFQLSI